MPSMSKDTGTRTDWGDPGVEWRADLDGYDTSFVSVGVDTDLTELQTTNLKGEVQLFKGNKLSLYNLFSKKVRNARNASDTTPIESTVPRMLCPSGCAPKWAALAAS